MDRPLEVAPAACSLLLDVKAKKVRSRGSIRCSGSAVAAAAVAVAGRAYQSKLI